MTEPKTLSRWQRIKAAAGRVVARVKLAVRVTVARIKFSRPVMAIRRATLRSRIWLVSTYRKVARNPYAKATYFWFRRMMALWVLSIVVVMFVVAPVGTLIIIGAVLLAAYLASIGYSHAVQAASPFVSGVARGVGKVASVLRVLGLVAIAIPTVIMLTTVTPFALAGATLLVLELVSLYVSRHPAAAPAAEAESASSWDWRTQTACEACGGRRGVNVDGVCLACEIRAMADSAKAAASST